MKISLVMIVKNEELKIGRCLESVRDIVSEIVVVDTGSTDDTINICKSYQAKVFNMQWNDSFAEARNYALSKSTGDWNLILDGDEYIKSFDLVKIKEFIINKNQLGVASIINRTDDCKESMSNATRLIPRGVYFEGAIHEQVDSKLKRVEAPVVIYHDGYAGDKRQKVSRNLNILRAELKKKPNDEYLLYQMAKTLYVGKSFSEAELYFKKLYNGEIFDTGYFNDAILLYLYNCLELKKLEDAEHIISDMSMYFENSCDFYFVCGLISTEIACSDVANSVDLLKITEECYLRCLQIGESKNTTVVGTGSFLASYNLHILYSLLGNSELSDKYLNLSNQYKRF